MNWLRRWVYLIGTVACVIGSLPRTHAQADQAKAAEVARLIAEFDHGLMDQLLSEAELELKQKAGDSSVTTSYDSAVANGEPWLIQFWRVRLDIAAYGISATRLMIYNKKTFENDCRDRASAGGMIDISKADNCVDEKLGEIKKFLMLEQAVDAKGVDKLHQCKIKTRQYSEELKFPPFDFLRDADGGPGLFDFVALNQCILAS